MTDSEEGQLIDGQLLFFVFYFHPPSSLAFLDTEREIPVKLLQFIQTLMLSAVPQMSAPHPVQGILMSSLEDPMHESSLCIIGINAAIFMVGGTDADSALRHGYFPRLAMDFICSSRSDAEHSRLYEHLSTCSCNLRAPEILHLHLLLNSSYGKLDAFDMTLWRLCTLITEMLHPLTPGKFRKPKKGAQAARQSWPSSVSDILPKGGSPAEVLDAILRWAAVPGRGYPTFTLIASLAQFWEPFTEQLLRTSSAFILAADHLEHAANSFLQTPAADVGCWGISVSSCTGFFLGVARVESRGVLNIVLTMLDRMAAIRLRLVPILEGMPEMGEPRRWFETVHRMETPDSPEPFIASGDFMLPGSTEPLSTWEEIYATTFVLIWEVRNRNQCMYLDCTRPINGRTAVCARCGVVRYCSREVRLLIQLFLPLSADFCLWL
jgi:hypothetical protein